MRMSSAVTGWDVLKVNSAKLRAARSPASPPKDESTNAAESCPAMSRRMTSSPTMPAAKIEISVVSKVVELSAIPGVPFNCVLATQLLARLLSSDGSINDRENPSPSGEVGNGAESS